MALEALSELLAREDQGLHEAELLERAGDGWRAKLDPPGHALACEPLQTGPFPLELAVGDRVLVLVSKAGRAYILGRLGVAPADVRVHVERLVLDAGEEVVLHTRRSSLRVGADGDVEVRGARILSRASRLQRLLAPLLRLN
jgi:hypothetical protein